MKWNTVRSPNLPFTDSGRWGNFQLTWFIFCRGHMRRRLTTTSSVKPNYNDLKPNYNDLYAWEFIVWSIKRLKCALTVLVINVYIPHTEMSLGTRTPKLAIKMSCLDQKSWKLKVPSHIELLQGPVARSMVSVNQRLIPWQRIGFDTA